MTTVRTTPDTDRIKKRFGELLIYQEAFEVGCDLIERHLIEMEKEENKPNLLIERNFYDSLKPIK